MIHRFTGNPMRVLIGVLLAIQSAALFALPITESVVSLASRKVAQVSSCTNEEGFAYKGDKKKDCEYWVWWKSEKRCKKPGVMEACPSICNLQCLCMNSQVKFDFEGSKRKCSQLSKRDCKSNASGNKLVEDFCPKKCDFCFKGEPRDRCEDIKDYKFKNKSDKTCKWVKQSPLSRCRKRDNDNGVFAHEACPSVCDDRCTCKNSKRNFKVGNIRKTCKDIKRKRGDCELKSGKKTVADYCPRKCKSCYKDFSASPTGSPTVSPYPTSAPTDSSVTPTIILSASPSDSPTNTPTNTPSASPSDSPSASPSDTPSDTPSASPSDSPSASPSDQPSPQPTATPGPTGSHYPTDTPSISLYPSDSPSTGVPSDSPSDSPSDVPSDTPSDAPSDIPEETMVQNVAFEGGTDFFARAEALAQATEDAVIASFVVSSRNLQSQDVPEVVVTWRALSSSQTTVLFDLGSGFVSIEIMTTIIARVVTGVNPSLIVEKAETATVSDEWSNALTTLTGFDVVAKLPPSEVPSSQPSPAPSVSDAPSDMPSDVPSSSPSSSPSEFIPSESPSNSTSTSARRALNVDSETGVEEVERLAAVEIDQGIWASVDRSAPCLKVDAMLSDNMANRAMCQDFLDLPFKKQESCGVEKVPKIFYTVSKDSKLETHQLGILAANPSFEHRHFSDFEASIFVRNNCGDDVGDAYSCLAPPAFRADLFRFCALHSTGGLYLDSDIVPVVPLEELYDPCANATIGHDWPQGRPQKQMKILAGQKGAPIYQCMMNKIIGNIRARFYPDNSLAFTGPILLQECYEQYPDNVSVTYRDTRNAAFPYSGMTGKDGLLTFEVPSHSENYQVLFEKELVYRDTCSLEQVSRPVESASM